jgi:transposase
MIPMRITPIRAPSSGSATKVDVVESVDPEEPAKIKAEPGEHFITEILTTEAAQDEMAGLAEALKRQQAHHEMKPEAMYADAGYVTESTLSQAEGNAMEPLGPTRPDPHKGPYNADGIVVDVENQRAVCPQGKTSTQCSHIKDNYMGAEYYRLEWGNQCDGCPVQKQCTRAKSGRRLLVVGLRHDLVAKRRKEMKRPEFSQSMYPRNGIEGTHSELVRGHGPEADQISRAQPSQSVALLHGCRLQRETISKTPGFPDRNGDSEPCVRVGDLTDFTATTRSGW